jgi:hypothetical protein
VCMTISISVSEGYPTLYAGGPKSKKFLCPLGTKLYTKRVREEKTGKVTVVYNNNKIIIKFKRRLNSCFTLMNVLL